MSRHVSVPLWTMVLLHGVLWAMILRDAYDYITWTRPLHQCFKAHKEHCVIGKTHVYIRYRDEK